MSGSHFGKFENEPDEIDAKREAAYQRYLAAFGTADEAKKRRDALAEITQLYHEKVRKMIEELRS